LPTVEKNIYLYLGLYFKMFDKNRFYIIILLAQSEAEYASGNLRTIGLRSEFTQFSAHALVQIYRKIAYCCCQLVSCLPQHDKETT